MDIRNKVIDALSESFPIEYAHLDEDDGITGFVVSPRFQNVPTMDRQSMIERALRDSPIGLSRKERRHVLMIAGLTPEEYNVTGAQIRVHKITGRSDGSVEIVVHGENSDAEYVRRVLERQTVHQATKPKPVPGAVGVLVEFQVKGDGKDPLTKEDVIRILESDQYIQVVPNA